MTLGTLHFGLVIPLIMVRFSIRKHRWKAEDLCYLKICENVMPTNCLWPKFVEFSCLYSLSPNNLFFPHKYG